jgi:uncharacterized membrane protein YkoI
MGYGMTTRRLSLTSAVLVLGVTTLSAADTKIQAHDLPVAVQQAIPAETRGAAIRGYAKETEGIQTMYEVETTLNGHARALLFDAHGKLVEVEEATTLEALPEAVRTALKARGKVLSVETVTRGKAVTYEATIRANGKTFEVTVNADGQAVKP